MRRRWYRSILNAIAFLAEKESDEEWAGEMRRQIGAWAKESGERGHMDPRPEMQAQLDAVKKRALSLRPPRRGKKALETAIVETQLTAEEIALMQQVLAGGESFGKKETPNGSGGGAATS